MRRNLIFAIIGLLISQVAFSQTEYKDDPKTNGIYYRHERYMNVPMMEVIRFYENDSVSRLFSYSLSKHPSDIRMASYDTMRVVKKPVDFSNGQITFSFVERVKADKYYCTLKKGKLIAVVEEVDKKGNKINTRKLKYTFKEF